jgi:hypothetical protein
METRRQDNLAQTMAALKQSFANPRYPPKVEKSNVASVGV